MFKIILLFLLSWIFMMAVFDKRIRRNRIYSIAFFLTIFLYSLLMGCRSEGIPDTLNYKRVYENITWAALEHFDLMNKGNGIFYMEYGYLFLCAVFKSLHVSFPIFQSMIYMFEFFLIFTGIGIVKEDRNDKERNFYLELLAIICIFGLYYQGIAVRSGLSFALLFFGTIMLCYKKKILPILCFAIAFTMHRASLIAIIIFICLMLKLKASRFQYFLVWLGLGIVLLCDFWQETSDIVMKITNLLTSNIRDLSSSYINNFKATSSNRSMYNFYCWLLGGGLVFIKEKRELYHKFLNIYFMGLIVMILLSGFYAGRRIYDIFLLFSIPILFMKECKNDDMKNIFCYGVCLGAAICNVRIWNI